MSQYRFDMWVVARPDDAYYYTNWDKKQRVTVVAKNRAEAVKKIPEVMGSAGRNHYWTYKVISITDARLPQGT